MTCTVRASSSSVAASLVVTMTSPALKSGAMRFRFGDADDHVVVGALLVGRISDRQLQDLHAWRRPTGMHRDQKRKNKTPILE